MKTKNSKRKSNDCLRVPCKLKLEDHIIIYVEFIYLLKI